MILLGITILIFIIGILCIIKGNCCSWDGDGWIFSGMLFLAFSVIFLTIEIGLLLRKPLEYKNFKIKYDTVKEIVTSKDDIRDATFTNRLIETNERIRSCNEFKNSKWIGIFQNKKICELELLTKSEESEMK